MHIYHYLLPVINKTLVLLLCISLMTLLNGCSYEDGEVKTNNDPIVFKLRFGHDMPENSAHHRGALRFVELVESRSNNRVAIEIFPNQTLGNDYKMISMAQNGELDIILPPTAKLSTTIPAIQVLDLPFLFATTSEAHRVMSAKIGLDLLNLLKKHNLIGAAYWESGFKQFTTDRPIKSVKDLASMKFRIMRSEVISDQFLSWGAKTLVVDFDKTRNALSEGVVNGQENPLGSIYGKKFHEVQPHLILSNHGYLAQVLAFSKQNFNALPKDIQEILLSSAREAAEYQWQEVHQAELRILEEMEKSPILISEFSEDLRNELKEKTQKVIEKYRMRIGSDIIERITQTIDEGRVYSGNELVIALDADLAGNSLLSGLAIRRGIEIAIDEINSAGGLLGKKLVLTARDNSMVSARGIDNLDRFSKIPNLLAVFGGISSPVVLSELEIIHRKKLLFLDPWAAATKIVDNGYDPNFVFRVSVRDEFAAGFLLPKALEESKKVALLLSNNGWGRSNHDALIKELEKRGLKPALTKWFDWGVGNHKQIINEIYESGSEVIIYVGNPVEAAGFVKEIAAHDHQIPVISHWGITGGNFIEMVDDAIDKVDLRVLQTFSFINNNSKMSKSVVAQYKEKYNIQSEYEIVSSTGTAHAYDLMHLLALGVKKAESSDSDEVRRALESLGSYQGLVKNYRPAFTPKRHDALDESNFFLARYKDGVLVPL